MIEKTVKLVKETIEYNLACYKTPFFDELCIPESAELHVILTIPIIIGASVYLSKSVTALIGMELEERRRNRHESIKNEESK
jgi:hypothetical protein